MKFEILLVPELVGGDPGHFTPPNSGLRRGTDDVIVPSPEATGQYLCSTCSRTATALVIEPARMLPCAV
jgi:hypothetical protein